MEKIQDALICVISCARMSVVFIVSDRILHQIMLLNRKNGRVASIKVLIQLFKSWQGLRGQSPPSRSAHPTQWVTRNTQDFRKVPFFASLHLHANALLAKGKKEEQYS